MACINSRDRNCRAVQPSKRETWLEVERVRGWWFGEEELDYGIVADNPSRMTCRTHQGFLNLCEFVASDVSKGNCYDSGNMRSGVNVPQCWRGKGLMPPLETPTAPITNMPH